MLLRQATVDDNGGLLALEAMAPPAGYAAPPRSNFFSRSSAYDRAVHIVAVLDGQIVGVQSGALKRMRLAGRMVTGGILFNLRVHPNYRRQRIGAHLKAAVEDRLAAAGAAYVYCYVGSENEANQSLLKKQGYKQAASVVFNLIRCDAICQGRDTVKIGDITGLPDIMEASEAFYREHDGVPHSRLLELYRNSCQRYAGSVVVQSGNSRAWGSIWAENGDAKSTSMMFDVGCEGECGPDLFAQVTSHVLQARPASQIMLAVDVEDDVILGMVGQRANRMREEFVMMKWLTHATTCRRPFYFDVRD